MHDMKILLARNSKEGVVASLLMQSHFKTEDPIFHEHEKAHVFTKLGIPVYSAGVKGKGFEFYIDDEGDTVERDNCVIKKDKSIARTAFELFPEKKYRDLVDLCERSEDFYCFFDLYGADVCFGKLKNGEDYRDKFVINYKKLQEELAEKVLLSKSDGEAEVFRLPREAGRLCRKLVFFGTKAKITLMIQDRRFYAYCRHGFEDAFSLRNFKVLSKKGGKIQGIFTARQSPLKIKENLELAIEKYKEKGEMFR